MPNRERDMSVMAIFLTGVGVAIFFGLGLHYDVEIMARNFVRHLRKRVARH
jgi:hypothetical protein